LLSCTCVLPSKLILLKLIRFFLFVCLFGGGGDQSSQEAMLVYPRGG
jgi:hypothetical protein